MKRIIPALMIFFLISMAPSYAKLGLHPLLKDNMVLQQKSHVKLWGTAEPNEKITVEVGWLKGKAIAKADKDGKWALAIN